MAVNVPSNNLKSAKKQIVYTVTNSEKVGGQPPFSPACFD